MALKNDKGVAGLTILLGLVTMLFVIGLLVMIFSLMGGELQSSDSVSASESTTGILETGILVNETGTPLTDCTNANQGVLTSIAVINDTGETIASGNYTFSACTVSYEGLDGIYNNSASWNVTSAYTYAGASWDVMNDTTSSIGSVTDWFTIFIVIGAMVVLILLTVIIITAIKGSGLMAGSSGGQGNIGSA